MHYPNNKTQPLPWNHWLPLIKKRQDLVRFNAPSVEHEFDNVVNWFDSRWVAPTTWFETRLDSTYNTYEFPPDYDKQNMEIPFFIANYSWLMHELAHFLTCEESLIYEPWWGEHLLTKEQNMQIELPGSPLRTLEFKLGGYLGFYRLSGPKSPSNAIKTIYHQLKEREYRFPPK